MKLLLDSHIAIALAEKSLARYGSAVEAMVQSPANESFVSAASLWEIAIKYRLGKLKLNREIENWPAYLTSLRVQLLPITPAHAVEDVLGSVATRDPFDKLLLAQCQIEGLRLVTVDRALVSHPLAWRP